jgi:hypothetical protein
MMFIDARTACAILLILSSLLDITSNSMWYSRNRGKGLTATATYLAWERGLLITAYVLAALGVSALELVLNTAGATLLPRLATAVLLIGVVVAVVVEAAYLTAQRPTPGLEYVMVVVLFVGEALVGGALLAGGVLPVWVGWTVVVWNIGWLAALTIFNPRDIYYPVLHFFSPLLIGAALLLAR